MEEPYHWFASLLGFFEEQEIDSLPSANDCCKALYCEYLKELGASLDELVTSEYNKQQIPPSYSIQEFRNHFIYDNAVAWLKCSFDIIDAIAPNLIDEMKTSEVKDLIDLPYSSMFGELFNSISEIFDRYIRNSLVEPLNQVNDLILYNIWGESLDKRLITRDKLLPETGTDRAMLHVSANAEFFWQKFITLILNKAGYPDMDEAYHLFETLFKDFVRRFLIVSRKPMHLLFVAKFWRDQTIIFIRKRERNLTPDEGEYKYWFDGLLATEMVSYVEGICEDYILVLDDLDIEGDNQRVQNCSVPMALLNNDGATIMKKLIEAGYCNEQYQWICEDRGKSRLKYLFAEAIRQELHYQVSFADFQRLWGISNISAIPNTFSNKTIDIYLDRVRKLFPDYDFTHSV